LKQTASFGARFVAAFPGRFPNRFANLSFPFPMSQFIRCRHCGRTFPLSAPGTKNRNHCPHCLFSVHLDNLPGDRNASCGGEMAPIAVSSREDGEWMLVHRCHKCGTLHVNRVAGDDNAVALMQLAAKPLANPPFPAIPE